MTRTIQTLRKQIINLRDKGMKWNDICKQLEVFGAGEVPDPGMASMIAYGRKGVLYEPTDPETRKRLGLSIVCKTCKRPIREKKVKQESKSEFIYMKWWRSISPEYRQNLIKILYLKENG